MPEENTTSGSILVLFAWFFLIATAAAQENDRLLWASVLPTPEAPFSFYHIAKTGGSSLRTILHKAATRHNLTSVIPCKNRACECQLNAQVKWQADLCKGHITDTKASVYAGHISPNSLLASRGQLWSNSRQCVIIVREPMERIISHYTYFELKKSFNETGAHPLRISLPLPECDNLTPLLPPPMTFQTRFCGSTFGARQKCRKKYHGWQLYGTGPFMPLCTS